MRSPLACALAVVVVSVACDPPPPLAQIAVSVREPFGVDRRHADFTLLTVTGGEVTRSLTFAPETAIAIPDIALGDQKRTINITLFSHDAETPTAIARTDPVPLPALSDEDRPPTVVEKRATIFAAPDRPERMDDQLPSARAISSACDDRFGRAWVFGGAANGYVFSETELQAKDAIAFPGDAQVQPGGVTADTACDGDDRGRVVVFAGGTVSPAKLVFSPGTDEAVNVSIADTSGLHPFVRVVGDSVWVATEDLVTVYPLGSDQDLASRAITPAVVGPRYAMIAPDALLIGSDSGATKIATLVGNVLNVVDAAPLDLIAADNDSFRFLVRDDGDLLLESAEIVSVGEAAFTIEKGIALGFTPTKIVVLPDERVAAIDGAHVQIEGGAVNDASRSSIARTVGGAVLLFGGEAGFDVVVPR